MPSKERLQAAVAEAEKSAWRLARRHFGVDQKQTQIDVDSYYRGSLFHEEPFAKQIETLVDRANLLAEDGESGFIEQCAQDFANSVPRLIMVAHQLSQNKELLNHQKLTAHDAMFILSQHENSLAVAVQREMGINITPEGINSALNHLQTAKQLINTTVSLIKLHRQAGMPIITRVIPQQLLR